MNRGKVSLSESSFEIRRKSKNIMSMGTRPGKSDDEVQEQADTAFVPHEETLVLQYRRTADARVLEQLHALRERSLRRLAQKNAHHADSGDDLFSELKTVWLNCISGYNPKAQADRKSSFDSYLNTALRNYIAKTIRKKYADKRMDNSGVTVESTMASLDQETEKLRDLFLTQDAEAPGTLDQQSVIDSIAGRDNVVRAALQMFANDTHIKTLHRACKLKSGTLRINKANRDALAHIDRAVAIKRMRELIKQSKRFPRGFVLLNYQVYVRFVKFEVRDRDDAVYERVLVAIKRYQLRIAKQKNGFEH